MSHSQSIAAKPAIATRPLPEPVHRFSRLRSLAWQGNILFASHAYTLLSADMSETIPEWRIVAPFRPRWWRNVTASARLTYRLFDDGFQALAALESGHLIASVAEGIISVAPGEMEFHMRYELPSGSRPLQIAATRDGQVFWSANQSTSGQRRACIYVSPDRGFTWDIAHAFPIAVTGIRGLVYDQWENCLWLLAEEDSQACRVFRASLDFRIVEVAISGCQASMSTCVPVRDAIYFGSHDPEGSNHIFRLHRNGSLIRVASIKGVSVSACQVGTRLFFSTTQRSNDSAGGNRVRIYRSSDGDNWEEFLAWEKDFWPQIFQAGCALVTDGNNSTDLLAVSTVALSEFDQQTTLWRI